MVTQAEIGQLIETLNEDGQGDAMGFTAAHIAALELIRLGEITYEPLLAAMQTHPQYLVRGWAAWILGHVEYLPAIPALQAACQDDSWYVQSEAEHALARLLV